jgi:hypothetical protein
MERKNTMSNKSHADTIREYFYRQYELEEGTPQENVYALFDEKAVYYVDETRTVTRDAIAEVAYSLRQTPKYERIAKVSDLQEDGDRVSFHMTIRFRNTETGELVETHADHVWRFNAESKVIEARPKQLGEIKRALEASGVALGEPARPA